MNKNRADVRSDEGGETNISGPPSAGGDGPLESIGSYHGHEPIESIGSASFSVTSAFGPNPSRRVMAPFGKPLDPARVTPGTIYPADYESDTGSSSSQDSDGGDVSVHAFPGSSSIGAPGAMAAKITRQWTIGADEHCDIVVRCPYVSRRHCRVTESESRYWIEDLGSRNGTHVNSRVVNGRVLVTGDDMITLGTLARMPWPPSTDPVCRASGSNEVRIVRIGRSPSSDIRLNHSSVSRRHAQLSIFGDHMLLEDLGSTNGTFVGDSSLRINRQRVALSDTVRIGKFSFPVSHLLRSESVA